MNTVHSHGSENTVRPQPAKKAWWFIPTVIIVMMISALLLYRYPEGLLTLSCRMTSRISREGFEDVTTKTGIAFDNEWARNRAGTNPNGDRTAFMRHETVVENLAGGVVAADFNNDGLIDLYFVSGDYGHLFQNQGNFIFQEVTSERDITPYQKGTGAVAADYDNDGWKDLLLYGDAVSPRLYRNIQGKRFEDVTKQIGLAKEGMVTYGAAFADYNRDGWLDLYVANYGIFTAANIDTKYHEKGQPDILFQNNQGKFSEVTKIAGIDDDRWGLAVSFFDYNRDLWPDIFVANDYGFNALYENNQDGTFQGVSTDIFPAILNNGMGIAVADYDRDGWQDLYVTGIYFDKRQEDQRGNLLLRNLQGKKFDDVADESKTRIGGWGWGVVPIDYNNDGRIDIAEVGGFSPAIYDSEWAEHLSRETLRSRAYFYENRGGNSFQEKARELCFSIELNGRGLVAADLDNDGYADLVVNQAGREPKIFRNLGGENNWLKVKLRGTQSNTDGIGAQVWVRAGNMVQLKEVATSGTYLSSSDLTLLFGLGAHESVDEITIEWPAGSEQRFQDIPANQQIIIREGSEPTDE